MSEEGRINFEELRNNLGEISEKFWRNTNARLLGKMLGKLRENFKIFSNNLGNFFRRFL